MYNYSIIIGYVTTIIEKYKYKLVYYYNMNLDRFNGGAGELIRQKGVINGKELEYSYFLPKELPAQLPLTNQVAKKLSDANLYLGELKGLAKNIKNINLFIGIYKTKEAVVSSKIEGTRVSLTEAFLSEAGDKEKSNYLNRLEVMNYLNALNFSLEKISQGNKVNKDLINHTHYLILQKVRGANRAVGQYRKTQNWIGSSYDIANSIYIPPHSNHIDSLMNYLFSFMDKIDDIPPLIKIGLMHYYFETIHPYEDGNGRVGRTLILLYFHQLGILNKPLLYLSPFFEKYRDDYYNYLMKVREEADYINWLNFFLEGVSQVSIDTCERLRKLIDLHEDYEKRLKKAKATRLSSEVLDKLFENPFSTIPRLQVLLNTNYQLTMRAVNYLKKCNIITEYTYRKRNKFYRAEEILNIIEKEQ